MTKELLNKSEERIGKLEKLNRDRNAELYKTKHELENFKILLTIKDKKIQELKEELKSGRIPSELNQLRYGTSGKHAISSLVNPQLYFNNYMGLIKLYSL